ncbi:hypothetical protein A4H97_23935 [Niastella yeongjuensis]|uniref:Uncharacterized protein n=2 Tax=Niastella yeongjuensis TaxID=354355 RepID=A0A1V9F2Z6_9BACT|nr:hypothetical protein A4H97_23935 [Niastella yeongjuensis]
MILIVIVAFISCSKDDGAIPERVSIEDVPAVTTNLESGKTVDTIRLSGSPGNYEGKVKVALYFNDATPPAKVDIVVRKNGAASNVKLYKADVTSLPVNFTIKVSDLETLFGAAIKASDSYDFAPDIYVKDKKYEAFPVTGIGSGSGVTGMSAVGFGEFVRFYVK